MNTRDIVRARFGSKEVVKIMYGDKLVWPLSRPMIITFRADVNGKVILNFNNKSNFSSNLNLKWTNIDNAGVGDGKIKVTFITGNTYEITGLNAGDRYDIEFRGHLLWMFRQNNDLILDIKQWGDFVVNPSDQLSTFWGCSNLRHSAIDFINKSDTEIQVYFAFCTSLNEDDFSSFSLIAFSDVQGMFQYCSNFKGNGLETWDYSNATDMVNFVGNTAITQANYDAIILKIYSQINEIQSNVQFTNTPQKTKKPLALFAKRQIIAQKNWTITDLGHEDTDSFIIVMQANANGEIQLPSYLVSNYDLQCYNIDNFGIGNQYIQGVTTNNKVISGLNANDKYEIRIQGVISLRFNNNATWKDSIYEIKQWGNIEIKTMSALYYGCSNLVITATDIPNITMSTNSLISNCFRACPLVDFDVTGWDISLATNASTMFYQATNFKGKGLDTLDWSNVTNMNNILAQTSHTQTNYDLLLNSLANQNVQSGVSFRTDAQYTIATSQTNRDYLTITKGWTIIDGGGV